MEPHRPPDDDPRLQPLVEYLEQHRRQFDLEALRKQLLAAGHPPELVAQALDRVGAPTPPRRPAAWPLGLLVMLANLVALVATMAGLIALAATVNSRASAVFIWAALGVGPLALLVELVAGLRLVRGPRDRLGRALIWGVGFTIAAAAVLVALLFGACIVLLSGAF